LETTYKNGTNPNITKTRLIEIKKDFAVNAAKMNIF